MSENTEGKTKCQFCGKWITAESALEHEAGSYCLALREQGWDAETLKEHRASLTVDEVPVTEDGREYIKVAVLHRLLVKEGIPVSRMVRAIGKDRGIEQPLHPNFKPFYVGRARYVHPDCGTQWGFDFLQRMNGRSSSTEATTKALEEALEDA